MTKLILGLLSAIVLWAATPDAKTEKEVLAALDAYKQALIARDAAALSKVLSDDLTYTHSSNKHEDKAAVLASLKGPTHVEAIEFKDVKTRLYGSAAVVTADADFTNNVEGTVTLLHLHVIHVFVKSSDGWQMVARQTTRYPEPAAAAKSSHAATRRQQPPSSLGSLLIFRPGGGTIADCRRTLHPARPTLRSE